MRKATSKRFTIRPKLAESPSIACPHRHAALRGCDSMKTSGLENRSLVAYKTDRINPGLRVDSRSESALTRGYCLSSRCDCGIVGGTKDASIDSLRTAICRTAQPVAWFSGDCTRILKLIATCQANKTDVRDDQLLLHGLGKRRGTHRPSWQAEGTRRSEIEKPVKIAHPAAM